jgi:hypothetical protein
VNSNLRRGLSDFNVGQNLTVNYMWDVPSDTLKGPAAWTLRGWQIGGIALLRSGFPFTAVIGGDPLGQKSTNAGSMPNRLTGTGCGSAVNPGNPVNYIKTGCFVLPSPTPAIASLCVPFTTVPGTCANLLGNEQRNSLIGPGVINYDFSLFKNNPVRRISDIFNLQFRAEFFNVLNRTNFSSPNANNVIFNQDGSPVSGAGLISSTATSSRQIQFAVKAIW